jgi:hypothetical protein
LFAIRDGFVNNAPVERLIVSDCYNAGTVYIIAQLAPNFTYGGLFGAFNDMYIMHWLNSNAIKISNTFNYGLVRNPNVSNTSNVDGTHIIIGFGGYEDFNDSHTMAIFSNIYYRPEIGGKLFGLSPSNGAGYGTDLVKTTIHSTTTAEFASAKMADLLNNGRLGASAPWEYIKGNAYPTLKATVLEDEDKPDVVSDEIAKAISDIVKDTEFTATDETIVYEQAETLIVNNVSELPPALNKNVLSISDYKIDDDNKAYVSPEKIKALAAQDESLNKRVNSAAGILPLPVIEVTVNEGETALFSYSMDLSRFAGAKIGDLTFMKITPYGLRLPRKASGFSDLADERYIITDESGTITEDSEVITTGSKNYILTVGVKDDGNYDWDTKDGHIIDPYAAGAPADDPGAGSNSGGGGCDTGAAMLPAMAAALVLAIKRRK